MASAKARITSYEAFLIKFPEHPLLGVGPKTRPDVIELLNGEAPLIHVGYLSYLYFYGVVGCLILFLAIFFLLRDAWIVGKRDNFWGSFYGLVSFCLANLTFVYFNFSEMGIVLSVIYLRYYNYKSSLPLVET
jgi:O-antigen ligase